ncbi:hypothetical protein L484_009875 [Morus notabilis]|uniref:Disease resistance N-terminal domain-containing protein n=1 Tax=Morus notabilis TaxID=981085 RepID=W9QWQ3_9ROSA|nr:hypothetical protein L484_009875 [Morus notabilis]
MALFLFAVAEGLVANLGSEALKKIKLPWGVKGELQKLNQAIFNIKAVLLDAEDKQANEEVRLLLAKLEDAVLRADNLWMSIVTKNCIVRWFVGRKRRRRYAFSSRAQTILFFG